MNLNSSFLVQVESFQVRVRLNYMYIQEWSNARISVRTYPLLHYSIEFLFHFTDSTTDG